MVRSPESDKGGAAAGGPAAQPEPTYTVYECVYPDASRRRAGEPEDEAVSRAFFELPGDAESFRSHNGGTVSPVQITKTQRAAMMRRRLLGRNHPKRWNPRHKR